MIKHKFRDAIDEQSRFFSFSLLPRGEKDGTRVVFSSAATRYGNPSLAFALSSVKVFKKATRASISESFK